VIPVQGRRASVFSSHNFGSSLPRKETFIHNLLLRKIHNENEFVFIIALAISPLCKVTATTVTIICVKKKTKKYRVAPEQDTFQSRRQNVGNQQSLWGCGSALQDSSSTNEEVEEDKKVADWRLIVAKQMVFESLLTSTLTSTGILSKPLRERKCDQRSDYKLDWYPYGRLYWRRI
jgi:hypothetical protein